MSLKKLFWIVPALALAACGNGSIDKETTRSDATAAPGIDGSKIKRLSGYFYEQQPGEGCCCACNCNEKIAPFGHRE